MVEGNKGNSFLIFAEKQEFEFFIKRKVFPIFFKNIEVGILSGYSFKRILFTAEHAKSDRIEVVIGGKRELVAVGDKNTDILAKLGALNLSSAYLIPWFLRTEIDASRNPAEIGKGLRLLTSVIGKNRRVFIEIHKNIEKREELETYHKLISLLNPSIIISIHGMHKKRKYDVILGFGENYSAIGGKKNAFDFKYRFLDYLDKVFNDLKLKTDLEVGIGKFHYSGTVNYVLQKHVIEKNKIGVQVEFNLKGRLNKENGLPTVTYQILIQALGRFMYENFILKNVFPRF